MNRAPRLIRQTKNARLAVMPARRRRPHLAASRAIDVGRPAARRNRRLNCSTKQDERGE
jgi:hypothetical protein